LKKKQTHNKSEESNKHLKETQDDKNMEYSEEDEFNPSLAAMEEEIKPTVISNITILSKKYSKLIKYQNEKLNCALNAKEFTRAKEISYKKIQSELIETIQTLQLNPTVLEDLVQEHYKENKKIVSLEGLLRRSAIEHKIPRQEFLKNY